MSEGKEVHRENDLQDVYPTVHRPCLRCGQDVMLHWNGGELDQQECCGLTYALVHGRIDYVVYEGSRW